MGAGEGSVFVGCLLPLWPPVYGESARKGSFSAFVGGLKIEAVPRSGRACHCLVLQLQPGSFRVCLGHVHGGSGFCSGAYLEVNCVLVEAEGAGAGSVVGPGIGILPSGMLQAAFPGASVAYYVAVDALYSCAGEDGLPLPEEGIGLICGGVGCANCGVSAANDVDVSVQRSVIVYASSIANFRFEAVLRPECP